MYPYMRGAFITFMLVISACSSEQPGDTPTTMEQMPVQPPVADRIDHSFTHHGITIDDPYAWLRDPGYPEVDDPKIIDYLEAENTYFDAYMAPLQPLVDTVFEELKGRQPDDDESVPFYRNGYWYQWRFESGAQYRTWYRSPREDLPADEWQVLLDEPELAAEHEYFRLGALAVSPDGKRLAYSTDTDGSERFRLRVIDIESSAELIPTIDDTIGNPVWNESGSEILYTVVSEEWRPYQVWRKSVTGDVPAALIYEEPDTAFFVGLGESQSEKYVFVTSGSHTSRETHFLPADDFAADLTLMSPRRADHEYYVDHGNQGFVIRSNRRHTNFDLYRADVDSYDESSWQLHLEGDQDHYLTGFLVLSDHLIVEERLTGLDQVRVFPAAGEPYYIDFPESAYEVSFGTNPNFVTDHVRLSYTSMTTPATVYDFALANRSLNTRKVQEIPSGYDRSLYVTERLMANARDGVDVPVSLVYHKDTPLDGSSPLYLYGYGAYGFAIPPAFSPSRISLLDRGFVFAIAHIRGGDDLGYDWYLQGKLKSRTNTFNDFVDVARHLVAEEYTRAGNIAIAGGSAGGELMGAVVNQAPDLWGAVAAHVPFVDVLNTILDDTLPLTPIEWDEWGNPITDPEAFDYIRSYSPYDQLKPGEYPPMLVTAGLNDPRVTYWEPAKYVAKLRHLKNDNNVLLLKTNMGAGHGGQSGRFDALKETAEEYAFFIQELEAGNP